MMNKILENMKEYFNSDITKDVDFRIKQLKKLKATYKKYEPFIIRALKTDLKKPLYEIYSMEFDPVLNEIDYTIQHLKKWAKPEKANVPSAIKPNKGFIVKEPFGVVLIINAFNYPFDLAFRPLIGAIAAGNCAIIKTASAAAQSGKIIETIINEAFDRNYIACFNSEGSRGLIELGFDYIFFTGSTKTGKLVAETAAKNLIPYTLELGGKSPAIISKKANLELAVKKIVWGKFINAGQTCIAPDYVLLPEEFQDEFKEKIRTTIKQFYGSDPQMSDCFGRIIDEKAFARLFNLINYRKIISGGKTDECGLYIEPTVQWAESFEDKVMQDEIFGPILPVLTYKNLEDVVKTLKTKEKPLALYFFTQDKKEAEIIISSLSFGGGCINGTMLHIASLSMPFGGVGMSGTGCYHGKYSFDTFTHKKSILMNIHKKMYLKNLPPYKI